MTTRTKAVLAAAALAVVGLAVGLTLALTSGSSKKTATHEEYARLYLAATVGTTTFTAVESEWPQPPYQDYRDGTGNRCLEWFDKPTVGNGILYDLCFNPKGVLVSKQTP